MSDKKPLNDDKLMSHEYDGIQELDNELPPWWVMLFISTIVYSVLYMGYYHVTDMGLSQVALYEENEKEWESLGQKGSSGKSLYAINCMSCHGKQGQGSFVIKAPQIAGQAKWYLKTQLNNFKNDLRGIKEKDIPGNTMRSIAKSVLQSEGDVEAIIAYVSALKPTKVMNTIKGDVAQGEAKFKMMCFSCHGAKGEGNQALKAPRLLGLNDWYIVEQLNNFKHGLRGFDSKDMYGQMMVPMAMALSEKDMDNLALYIQTLNK